MQGCAQAELSIPEAVLNDINDIMEDDDFDEQIEKYEDILEESVSFQNIVYTEVECDTLYLFDKSKSPDDIWNTYEILVSNDGIVIIQGKWHYNDKWVV